MNDAPNHFYVYEHWRPDTGVCFYVGKGQRKRAWDMKLRNCLHKRVVAKLIRLGFAVDVRVIQRDMQEGVAFDLEKERIAHYRALNHPLVNVTHGGEGAGGWKASEETRAKQSAAAKRRNENPEYIAKLKEGITRGWDKRGRKPKKEKGPRQPLSAETRAKMSAAQKGKIISAETRAKIAASNTGKKRTEEQKAKLRWSRDTLTLEARAKMGAASRGNKYRLGTTHSQETRVKLRDLGFKNIELFRQFAHLGPMAMAKKVRCLEDGLVFPSASEAGRHYSIDKTAIIGVCKKYKSRYTAGGKRFEYLGDA